MAVIAAVLLANLDARAQSPRPAPKVGEQYEITRSYETSHQTSDGSSGSSSGRDTFLERVIGVREGDLELEYDLPQDATAEDRARNWQLPARVLKQSSGRILLLNRGELEARLQRWLDAAGWTRAVCGHWIFTWNAFRIECDPESVVETIEEFDVRSADLREGAPYRDTGARGPGTLTRVADGPDGARFTVVMEIDPDAVRRASAESDVAVGEIMQEPVTLEAALRERARESISGTIEVTFDTDSAGNVRRRTKVMRLETNGPGGLSETRTSTETLERRLVSGLAARR